VEPKTFGKVKDGAFTGMMITVITDPIGTAYLVTPDLLEILTQAGLQDVSLRSRPMNRMSVLMLLDFIDERGGVKQLTWLLGFSLWTSLVFMPRSSRGLEHYPQRILCDCWCMVPFWLQDESSIGRD